MNPFRTVGLWRALVLSLAVILAGPLTAQAVLPDFLAEVDAATLVPGAEGYGPLRDDLPVAPVQKGGETVGWAFITSDFVGTTGYSGKPIHTHLALDPEARVIGARLNRNSEPIVWVDIPQAEVLEQIASYVWRDLAITDGTTLDLDII